MPSNAYTNHLVVLLEDARELQSAHNQLRTGLAGRQWGLGSLNRAAVVLTVSAWEAYLEEVVREGIAALQPVAPPLGVWPALNASVQGFRNLLFAETACFAGSDFQQLVDWPIF